MRKVKTRKYMAGVLALVMLLGMLPMNALAFIFKVDTSPAVNLGESLPLKVSPPEPTHTYKFMVDGVLKDTQIIKNKGILTEPAVPLEEGRKFTGWSGQDGGGNPVEIKFGQPITVEGTKIITATAQFVPVVYVSFVLVEGEEGEAGYSEQVICTKEATPPDWTVDANGVPLNITEDGKVFSHWSATKKGPPFDFDTPINQDTTLYTVTKDAWTVTFDSNGGSAVLPKIVEGGQQIGDLPESERPGYTFKHWSLDGTNPIASNYIVTSNLTLHAVWEPGANTPYKVVYWLQNAEDDGYTFEEIVYKTGTTNGPAAYDSKSYTGFHFGSAENKTISGNGDTVVNVKYNRNVYTFTIELKAQYSNNWTTVSTTQLKYGQSTATPYNAAVAAYPYYSWYISRTSNTAYSEAPAMPNADLTVHGRYSGSAYQYTIGYYEKGTNTQIKEPYSFYSGSRNLSFTVEDGIDIPGFTVTPIGQWDTLRPGQVSKIYYTRNTYDLTFNKNNGNAPLVVSNIPFDSDISNKDTTGFNENTTYEEAGITYYFSGWYDNSACEGTPYSLAGKKMPAHNLALYAKWTPETYTVTFYETINGDTIHDEQTILPLHNADIPENDPPGTDFLGWYWYIGTSFVKFDFDTPVSGDFKLYPLFGSQTAKVLYNENFGDNPQTKEDPRLYLIGAKAKVMSPTGFIGAPSDKVFVGWITKNADGTTGTTYQPNELVTVPSGNITLYAQWASPAPTISLTYNGNGGKTLPPDEHATIVYSFLNNETHIVIANPFIRTGYNFTGWNTKADGTGVSYAVETEVLVDNDGDNTLYAQWDRNVTDVTATKNWVSGHAVNYVLVELKLYRQVPGGARELVSQEPDVSPEGGTSATFTYTWENVPTHNEEGLLYTYSIDEPSVPNSYTAVVTGSGYSFTVTNTYHNIKTLEAKKFWFAPEPMTPSIKPAIHFTLYRTTPGPDGVNERVPGLNPVSVPPGNDSIHWQNVILADPNNVAYSFYVKETDEFGNDYVPSGFQKVEDGLFVYNYKGARLRDVTVTKNWSTTTPEYAWKEVTVQLKRNNDDYKDPVKLNAGNNWTYTWEDLPNYKPVISGSQSPGYHSYTVEEVHPGLDIGYDDPQYTLGTVNDNPDSGNAQTNWTVTNSYTADDSVPVTITGKKTLTGKTLVADQFSFELSGGKLSTPKTSKNDADGNFSFSPIVFEMADLGGKESEVFTFQVKEVVPESNPSGGITYDTSIYNVAVSVRDNKAGSIVIDSIVYTVGGVVAEKAEFSNTYSAQPTSGLTLKGQKTLTGRPAALSAAEFSFVLSGDASEEVKNGADGGFSFTALTYTAAGTYNYVIKEKTPSNVAGVTDDTTKYAVVVTVIDNSQGQLLVSKVTVNGTEVTVDNGVVSGFNFTNEYEAEETSGLTLKGQKTLTGRPAALSAAEFSFVLSGDASEEVKNGADGGFSFTALTYTAAGTYNYVIKEKTPSNVAGVTDDTTKYAVVVTVIDNSQGQLLVSKVTVNGTEVTVDNGVVSGFNFTNEYEAEETSGLTLKGQKTLTGRPAALSAAEFSFVLSGDASEEVKNGADGGFSFTALTYTAAGTYNYVIKEKTPSNVAGVTDDTTEYAVVVTVIDNSQGQLLVSKVTVNGTEVTVDNGVVSGFNFTNEYEAEETSGLTLKGQKTLTGRPAALSAAEFSFVLSGDASEEVKNGADGGFSFTALTYTAAGTYNYVIKEKTPSNVAGVTDDTTKYAVVVTVIDNSQGQLLVSKVTVNGTEVTVDNGVVSGFNFTNEYEAEETSGLTLKGQKTLTGRPAALSAAEFSFVLSGDASEEVKNGADGGFSFTALTYTAAGTYNYVIKEKTPSNVAGVTDDTTKYAVVVTVIDNSQGQLLVSKVTVNGTEVTVDNGVVSGFNFTNEYEAEETSGLTLKGQKTLTGRPAALSAAEFSFVLSGDASEEVKNGADGGFSFTALTYTAAGTYNYVIKEKTPSNVAGVTDDTTKYAVVVTVIDNSQGQLLVSKVTVNDIEVTVDNGVVSGFNFTNEYEAEETSGLTLKGQKTLTGRPAALSAAEFSFVLSGDASEEVKNGADGGFSFTALTYTAAGTYNYVIKEKTPSNVAGVTDDTTKYAVVVTVIDNNQGQLLVSKVTVNGTEVTVDNGVVSGFNFTNEYEAEETSGLTLKGQKTLTGRPAALSAAEFSFVLSGDASEEVKNGTGGGFSFTALTYTAAGTYNYVIKEKTPSNVAGVTDDTTEYAVVVTVIDNSQGQLLVSKVTVNGTEVTVDNGVVSGFNFTNEYEAEETSGLTLKGQKTLTGRPAALSAAEFSFVLSGDASEEVKNGTGGGFSFTALTYTAAGTYNYVIKEKTPSNVAGVTDDTTEYAVVVTVIDNSQGQLLVSKVTVNGTEATVDNGVVSGFNFTNEYEAEETSGLTLKGQKTLTGRPAALSAAEFSFVLSGDASEEVKNVAGGGFSFTALTYTAAGTYNYVIKEKTPSNVAGVTDDTTEYAVVVTVIDNSQGQLLVSKVTVNGTEATVDNGVVSGFNFTNEYEAEETSGLTLKGQKTLTGRPAALSAAEFSFVLSGDASEEVKNGADGGFSFTALTYTAAGTYNYVIKEKTPSNVAGVTDDTTEYAVVVTVIDNSQGQLLVSKVTVNGTEVTVDNGVVSGFNFTNEYEAEETSGLTLKGQKTLTGRPAALSAAEFSFVLSGDASEEVKNVAGGGFSFTALTYTAAGTYNYVIKEKTPSNVAGVTDDTTEYAVVVTVIDNSQGQLLVSKVTVNGTEVTVDNGVVSGFNFTNEYEAEETSGLTLKGQKTLTGRPAALSAAEFSFVLSGDASEEVKNVAGGGFSFTALTYTAAGTYNYVIKEKTPSNVAGVTDDTTEYAVVVTVIDNSQGQLLVSKVTVNGTEVTVDNGVVSGFNFTNTYAASGKLTLSGTKTFTGRDATAADVFEFKLYKDTVADGNLIDTQTVTGSGTYSFAALNYYLNLQATPALNDLGNHTYVVVETVPVSNPSGGITYDTTEHTVVVTVDDAGDGKLNITATGVNVSGSAGVFEGTGLNFTNTYAASGKLTLSGTKTFTGRDATAADVFEFKLYKDTVADGNLIDTQTVTGSGTYSFAALNYYLNLQATPALNDLGNHTYVVVETVPVSNPSGGITYDTTEHTVVVTVDDAGDGKLNIIATGVNVSGSAGVFEGTGLNFTNTYAASGKLTLSGTKTFTGRDATAADVFEFKLYKDTVADGNLIDTQTVTGSGAYSFAALNYYLNLQATPALNDLGNHTYVVVETVPVSNPSGGITYDTTEHTVVVTVDDAGDGKLNIIATGVNVSGSAGVFEGTGLNFTNIYEANGEFDVDAEIGVTKKLEAGGRELTAGEFSFTLSSADDADNATLPGTNDLNGDVSFANLVYDEADIGKTYTYTVVENIPDPQESGMTYSANVLTFKVTVTDSGNGVLEATKSEVTGSSEFVNAYEAGGEFDVDAEIGVTKKLEAGGRELTAGEFSFTLSSADDADNATLPGTNDLNGDVSFANLVYDEADIGKTYTYTVVENIPDPQESGMTYSANVLTFKVTVTDSGNGVLEATKSEVTGSSEFVNAYEAGGEFDVDAEIGVTKKLEAGGRELTAGEFSFTLSSADDADNATLPGTNDLNGDVSFANLVYDEADIGKTYTYTGRREHP
ncbi:MAG: Spy0128 family protein [Christensenellales bacterium]